MILMAATPGFEEYVLEGLAKIFPGVPVFGGSAAHDLDGSTGNGGQLFVVGTEQVLHSDGVHLAALFTSCHVAVSLASLHRPTERRMLVTKLGKESAGGMDASRTIEELDHQPAAERYNELSGGKVSAALAALKERSSSGRGGGGGGGDDDPNAGAVNIHIDAALAPLARESIDDHGTRHCQLIHPSALLPNKAITTFAEAKEQEELVLLSVHSEGELVNAVEGACSAAVGWA